LPLIYDNTEYQEVVTPVIEEYSAWHNSVMLSVFYPETALLAAQPQGLANLTSGVDDLDIVQQLPLKRMIQLHSELVGQANKLLSVAQNGQKPEYSDMERYLELFDNFQLSLNRLENDRLLEDSGIDALTHLRSRRVMATDLTREVERRARLGKPFSMALIRIDDFNKYREHQDSEQHRQMLMAVADKVRKCLRSFDDAYRARDGEFILSLKHSDIAGGTAVLNRLRKIMDQEVVYVAYGAEKQALTLSGCVAEPMPGDNLEQLLSNMRQELERYDVDHAKAFEYHEVSPLKRFVENFNE
jgi:diguanylate cyclase